jgi:hypothetical protein
MKMRSHRGPPVSALLVASFSLLAGERAGRTTRFPGMDVILDSGAKIVGLHNDKNITQLGDAYLTGRLQLEAAPGGDGAEKATPGKWAGQ